MKKDMDKCLTIVRVVSGIGLSVGIIIFFISLFVNGFNGENLALFMSLSVMASAMMIFGFFHFLHLMDKVSGRTQRVE
ncbi:hypothetical protein [Bacillus massilinigeriensis]|uniref:hypothetical protein n=1 Tax=Bacillus massilionigeriensis TaxID=1805475 RepID=UPI00096AF179|nr:hypothetical protein [Bacillus massilionigeriensis]